MQLLRWAQRESSGQMVSLGRQEQRQLQCLNVPYRCYCVLDIHLPIPNCYALSLKAKARSLGHEPLFVCCHLIGRKQFRTQFLYIYKKVSDEKIRS